MVNEQTNYIGKFKRLHKLCSFSFEIWINVNFYNILNILLLENAKKRGSNKNQEARKREQKERKQASQSKSKSQPVIIFYIYL